MKYILLFVAVLNLVRGQEPRTVHINQGPVNGYKEPGLDVFSYYSIPFATAPSGTDKFKAPLPPPVWTDPFEAVEPYVVCHQYTAATSSNFREDCLVTTVFVPDTNVTNLPVVVMVHGGGFQTGSSNFMTPKHIVNKHKNVIAVAMNYRLGPHGFLCLGTEDIPGNAGMKDVVAALRWVKDNIGYFGGNPDDVTIAGCSAGGAAVDLLQLSKMAKGLFHKVIGQSGANVGAFAIQRDPIQNAREYAQRLNYQGGDNLKDLEDFYKNLSYEELLSVSNDGHVDVDVRFMPCLERDVGAEIFMDEDPLVILENGDFVRLPLLYGYSDMEGIHRVPNFEEWKTMMNEDFSQFMPNDLEFESDEQKQEIAQQVKEFYFGDQPVSNDLIQNYIDFNSDVMFVVAVNRAVTLQVRAGNNEVYLLVHSYVDQHAQPIPHIGTCGATHCAQMYIVMDPFVPYSRSAPKSVDMESIVRDIWINFIVTGNPTPDGNIPESVPKWLPAGEDRSPAMHFGQTTIEVIGPFEERRQKLWDDIYDRFRRSPVKPYDFSNAGSNLYSNYLVLLLLFVLPKSIF